MFDKSIPSEKSDGVSLPRSEASTMSEIGLEAKQQTNLQDFLKNQFDIFSRVTILMGICISILSTVLDAAFVLATDEDQPAAYTARLISVLYCLDILYIIEIVATIIFKNIHWDEVQHVFRARSYIIIAIEIVSVIPIDLFYYGLSTPDMRVLYGLRLRYCLRIVRVIYELYVLRTLVGYNAVFVSFMEYILVCVSFILLGTCIVYILYCKHIMCSYHNPEFIHQLFIMSGFVTGRGYHRNETDTEWIRWTLVTFSFFMYFFTKGFIIGKIVCEQKQQIMSKALFTKHLKQLNKRYAALFKKDPLMKKTFLEYYTIFWNCRGGAMQPNMSDILPENLLSEIHLDLSWMLLKHSHLFRDEEVHFLHHVSGYVKHTFMIPGQIIYKRNEFKAKMIYVASGIIQIYSEEDGESPILSLSGGTCLGESCLVISYPSVCTVVCKSYCEIDVLERADFIKVMDKYPDRFYAIKEKIYRRYENAFEYVAAKNFEKMKAQSKMEDNESRSFSLRWIKLTLRKLLSKDENFLESYLKVLNIEDRLTVISFNKLTYCAKYLDLLVPTDDMELVNDTIFLKTSCPCILQPNSMLVKGWEILTALVLLSVSFVYPFVAVYLAASSEWYAGFIVFVTFMWWLDLYIQISTAVRYKNELITQTSDILLHRCSSFLFILDIAAAVPLEVISHLTCGAISDSAWLYLQANRLLKIARIENFFKGINHSITHDMAAIKALKYGLYAIILIYWVAALHYLLMQLQGMDEGTVYYNMMMVAGADKLYKQVFYTVYLACHMVTGLLLIVKGSGSSEVFFVPLTFLQILITVMYIYAISDITATLAMNDYNNLLLQEHMKSVNFIMKDMEFGEEFSESIRNYIRHQWTTNKGYSIVYADRFVKEVPEDLYNIICYNFVKDDLQFVPLFQEIPKQIEIRCCGVCTHLYLPPGQIMTYAGEVSHEMYIITKGYCDLMSADNTIQKIIGPGDSFAVLETIMNLPVVNSVTTRTSCEMISLSHSKFKEAISVDPAFSSELIEVLKTTKEWAQAEELRDKGKQVSAVTIVAKATSSKKSFRVFGYKLNPESKLGREFHETFDRLGYFAFMKYLLLRYTITCEGRFLQIWEIFRCIFALTSVVAFAVPMINNSDGTPWEYPLYFLDATAWLDIYVRHHVCYYNKDGIEVYHPWKTAVHYWTHSFIIDVLGVLPLVPIVKSVKKVGYIGYLSTNRLLQAYRILKAFNYRLNHIGSAVRFWTSMMFIPFLIIIVNYASTILVNIDCTFGDHIEATDIFEAGVGCHIRTYLSYRIPISPLRLYLYKIYTASNILTATGMHSYQGDHMSDVIIVICLSLFGFVVTEFMMAKIISINLSRNVHLTKYQKEMRALIKFLNHKRIDTNLKQELIEHFEYIWSRQKGKKYEASFGNFNNALKENIMYHIFGKTMEESTVFSEVNPSFFRSLMLQSKHIIIIRRGVISRVNDVHREIYFIYKGQVEVLGPDYNRLLILPVGSLFGNLEDAYYGRRSLTMVAKGHVELMMIETPDFYNIINNYPRLKQQFNRLTSLNQEYLIGGDLPKMVPTEEEVNTHDDNDGESESGEKTKKFKKFRKFKKPKKNKAKTVKTHGRVHRFLFGIRKNTFIVRAVHVTLLILVCFVGFNLEMYRVTVWTQAIPIMVVLYLLDLLHLVKMYLQFHTAYENKLGSLVYDKREIARNYIKSVEFVIDVFSVIPFEIFNLAFWNSRKKVFVMTRTYLRCNRLLRIHSLISYFRKANNRVNVNVYLTRSLQFLFFIILTIQASTVVVTFIICTIEPSDTFFPMIDCEVQNLDEGEKFQTYLKQLSIIMSIFSTTPYLKYYPNAAFLIFLTAIMTLAARFLISLFVAETCATLEVVTHSKNAYEQKITSFKRNLEMKGLATVILNRMWRYMCLLWNEHQGLQFPVLLEEVPYYLREAVLNSMFGGHIRNHPVLGTCHDDLIRQMAEKMRTRTFFYGDTVAFKGQIDECMYFIHDGQINVIDEDPHRTDDDVDHVLRTGQMFGLVQGLYPRVGHKYTYRAAKFTILVRLERRSWIYLLDFFPASKEYILEATTPTGPGIQVSDSM